jgi:hypothetical protein
MHRRLVSCSLDADTQKNLKKKKKKKKKKKANVVPVKLHAALVSMARERNVKGVDRRTEVCFFPERKKSSKKKKKLRSDAAPFVSNMMPSQPVFEPTRKTSSVVPSIVKHMSGSLSVAAPPFVSSFASSSPAVSVSTGASSASSLSLFGSSIWGPDAMSWNASAPDVSHRRGPLGSLIVNGVNNSKSEANNSLVGPSSLSSSPTLEFFVPSLLSDDAMDELNDETFAIESDSHEIWTESDISLAQDLAMRNRFAMSLVNGAASAVSLQLKPVAVTNVLEAKPQVTAAVASGEDEKKVSRREQKKKRLEERKRLQQQEKLQSQTPAIAVVQEAPVAPAVPIMPTVTAKSSSMQWKDVVAKAAPVPPPILAVPVATHPPPPSQAKVGCCSLLTARFFFDWFSPGS